MNRKGTVSLSAVLAVVEARASDVRLTRAAERQQVEALHQAMVLAHELGASYRDIGERAGVTKSHVGHVVHGRER
jgi:hypothetical protein